jgi:hypothetical protein
METYKCIPRNSIITKTNKLNHENTEFHVNNSSFKTCTVAIELRIGMTFMIFM